MRFVNVKAALVCAFFVLGIHCDVYSDFQLADPFSQHWNFNAEDVSLFPVERSAPSLSETEKTGSERDREPLSPDYKEPKPSGTEEKPVLAPKPQQESGGALLPGGVVDVDAGTGTNVGGVGGFPQFGGFPEPDFGFSTFGQRHPEGGLFGLGGFFGSVGDYKPWWKGPNVCIEREESTDDGEEDEEDVKQKNNETETIEGTASSEQVPNFFTTSVSLSNCQQSDKKYECVTKINNHGVVKTFTVRYKCCYGYTRTRLSPGCEKQGDLKEVLGTIEDMNAKEFRQMIAGTGMEETLREGNFTVFVPTDLALNEFTEKMLELNNLELQVDGLRRRREVKNALSSKDLVLSHTTKGFVDLSDLVNEETINSEYDNSSIRINTYPTHNYEKMVTVNCAKVNKANNFAKNGIVHLMDGVVVPATKTLQEIIQEHPKLTNLKRVFESTDSFKHLRPDGHFTIFAPTDEAFNKLDETAKQRLLKGVSCAVSILKHHVTPHTVCSAAIIGNATTHNVEQNLLSMERTGDDQLVLEDKAKITKTDIMATNGVVHLIDTILIPESALHINDALKSENLTRFRDLIEKAGLTEEIDGLKNATVFAPSDEAFERPEGREILEKIGEDRQKLKELVMYHTIDGQMQSCDMHNNALIKTKDQEKPLRLNLYSTIPLFTNIINRATINCARLTGFDEKSCGSVIHEVNKILVPPTQTILDIVNDNPKYSTLSKIIKDTDIEKILQDDHRSITLLAPTDETFAGIAEADLKTLMEDKEKAQAVLKNHILTEVLCCSGVGPQSFGFNSLVSTLSRQHHQVGRTGAHQIRIGNAVVTKCDVMATNGIVHTVNRVLYPHRQQNPNFGGFFLFDL